MASNSNSASRYRLRPGQNLDPARRLKHSSSFFKLPYRFPSGHQKLAQFPTELDRHIFTMASKFLLRLCGAAALIAVTSAQSQTVTIAAGEL